MASGRRHGVSIEFVGGVAAAEAGPGFGGNCHGRRFPGRSGCRSGGARPISPQRVVAQDDRGALGLGEMLVAPSHEHPRLPRTDRGRRRCSRYSWRSGSREYGTRSRRPASTSIRSRDESVGRGMLRLRANWPKRRTPKNASRRISNVQRSPTSSSARPTDSALEAVGQVGGGPRFTYCIGSVAEPRVVT